MSSSSDRARSGSVRPSRWARSRKISVFGRASPTGAIARLVEREVEVAPRDAEVEVFELGGRRQDDVGVARRVGQELLDDHREEVVPFESGDHLVLVGTDDRRVRVVDEQQIDRRVEGRVRQHLAERGHVEPPALIVGGRGSRVVERRLEVDLGGTGKATARVSPCSGQRRQDGDRPHDLLTVGPVFGTDERSHCGRPFGGEPTGQPLDPFHRNARLCGDLVE